MVEKPPDPGKILADVLTFPGRRLRAIPWSEGRAKPAPRDLIKTMLVQGFNVEYGASGSGKSFDAIDKASAVARGVTWNGRRVRGGPVIYVAAEAAAGIWRRLQAYAVERLGEEEERPPIHVIDHAVDLLTSADDINGLIAEARRVGAVLIVIDTVSRVFGGGDENSSQDMARFVANLDRVRQEAGAAILAIHHTGKDATKGARGSSVLYAAADMVVEVEKIGDGSVRRQTVRKNREGEDGAVLDFRLRVVELGEDEDGDPITSCVVELEEGAGAAPSRAERLPASQKIALDALKAAVLDAGEIPPDCSHIPKATRAVPADLWKRYAIEKGISGSSDYRAQWMAFKRASEALIARQTVGRWGDWAWSA